MATAGLSAVETMVGKPRRNLEKWLFLGPPVLVVLFLSVFPFFFSIALLFMSWDFSKLSGAMEFNGINNFIRLFQDARFFETVRNTLFYVFVGVPLQYIVALLLALIVAQEIPGKKLFRVMFMLPLMISPIAVGFGVGRVMFDESMGPVNEFLRLLGIVPMSWFSNATMAPFTILFIEIWTTVPFMFLILLAGLQSMPLEPFEAAMVDGANRWQRFAYITFPMLLPVSITVLFIRGLDMFKIIDIVAVTTGGGPGSATETITLYATQIAQRNLDLGYAATIAWGLMVVVVLFAMLYLKFVRSRVPDI